ncbi:MAG: adenylyltransferase/cytidyltransferase family protein [Planctomycetes bacterium]|nr:adenylyltransferase/cytidyltransferase family protein [Planctomycetota bacterium]
MNQADHGSIADIRKKILTPESLARLVGQARHGGPQAGTPVIVQCHGCFDIVHPGHIRYLQFARTQGDILVVSITGDAQIQKGVHRPYIPQELRAENLAALAFVDYVVIDPHPTAAELLRLVRPDVYVKGREYATSDDPRFLAERAIVESHGGRTVFSSGDVVFSSSRIVAEMEGNVDLQRQRLAAVCRRNDISRTEISGILNRAAGKRIVVCGDVVVERYVLCDSGAMSTESPMMSLRQLDEKDFVGGAGFIALQLAEMGATPILVTTAGRGPLSNWLKEELEKAGVELQCIDSTSDAPLRTRFLVDEQKVFKVHRVSPMTPDAADERDTLERLESAAMRADGIVLHDAGFGLLSSGLLRLIHSELQGRVPFLAAGWGETQSNPEVMRAADLVCCSERRLRLAWNARDEGLSSLAYRVLKETQARRLIVTLGKNGLVTFDRPSQDRNCPSWNGRLLSEYLPTFATHVADRLGAGDSLLSAAALGIAAGGSLMQSAYLGAVSASMAVDRLGSDARWHGRNAQGHCQSC